MATRGTRPQVNIGLDPEDADVLAAVAFLNDVSGAEVLRPVVKAFLRKQRDNSEVRTLLRVRADRRRAM